MEEKENSQTNFLTIFNEKNISVMSPISKKNLKLKEAYLKDRLVDNYQFFEVQFKFKLIQV